MMTKKQDIDAALARLAEEFPRTFVREKYQPHWPLKVGIAADLMERGPELDHHKINVALTVYTRRIMYLRSLVAGAARVDLDGKEAGEVNRPRCGTCCGQARQDPGIAGG
jgi:ProP effector